MGHAMVLVKDAAAVDGLHAKQAEGVLRASMGVLQGAFAGLGLAEHQHPMSYVVAGGAACPPGDPLCGAYDLLPIGPLPITAYLPPSEIVLFALLGVQHGAIRTFGGALAESAGRASGDVKVAAAYLFGCGPHHVAVELTGTDHDEVLGTLLDLTDHGAVTDRDVLHVDVKSARGLGSRPRA